MTRRLLALPLAAWERDGLKAALVKAGLPANRFSAVGYGATQPIAGNDTDQGKAQNRRIDFVVK